MQRDATYHIGLIQTHATTDPAENLDRTVGLCLQAADEGAQIICTQELFRSPYFCQEENVETFDLAETIPGPSTEALCKVAAEKEVVIVASLFERRTAGLFHNTAAIIDADGSLMGTYRKMHIPDDPGYYEKFYFTPGDLGYQVWKTRYADIGVLICWDQWYPEAARLTALKGAEILFYPTAIGWAEGESEENNRSQHDAWETIQRSHAIANGVYVASVNRIGSEERIHFWGQSFVSDPFGEKIVTASTDTQEILLVECERNEVDRTRRHWPFLRDRRIDSFEDITKRFID